MPAADRNGIAERALHAAGHVLCGTAHIHDSRSAPTIRTGTESRFTIIKAVFAMPVLPAFVGIDQEIL